MDQNEMNDKILDDLFTYAAEQAELEILRELPHDDEIDHIFSDGFEKKMRNFLKRQRKVRWRQIFVSTAKRAADFFLLVFGTLSLLAVSVEAFRVKVLNFYINMEGKFSRIHVEENTAGHEQVPSGMWRDLYLPTFVPDGFAWVETRGEDGYYATIYQNDQNERFLIQQSRISGGAAVDTEQADSKKIKIKGKDALLTEKEGEIIIGWHDDNFIFLFIGNIEQKTAVKMVESVEYVEN